VDPVLYKHFKEPKDNTKVVIEGKAWAYKCKSYHDNHNLMITDLCTFLACQSPLTEVLKLWDFLFAFGFHLNVVCLVCQVVFIRDKLLAANR
jgi:cell cycle arrest protein BUB2